MQITNSHRFFTCDAYQEYHQDHLSAADNKRCPRITCPPLRLIYFFIFFLSFSFFTDARLPKTIDIGFNFVLSKFTVLLQSKLDSVSVNKTRSFVSIPKASISELLLCHHLN